MKTKGKGRGIKTNKTERQKTTFKRAYLTKAQAARRLQVTNAEFERLVIMKGVYPREPKRFEGSSGKDKSYYFAKDILWLEREPLLQKMREFSTYQRKRSKLRGKRMQFDMEQHEKNHKPQYSLSTIIKERYPTFTDCLRDCDDALTHIFLYAALPPRVSSESTIEGHTYLTTGMADQCRELRDRWLKYVGSTKGIRKTFISIKGLYYQANVKGETVTWQCPYEFTSKPPKDVVYRVMISFLEFYLQQVRFILYKLEHDQKAEQELQNQLEEEAEGVDAENFPMNPEELARKAKLDRFTSLFSGLVFYISRENPKMHLQFVITSFSGRVVDSPAAKGITHYVVDRPQLPNGEEKAVGVDYVQPQWLFDSINAKGLLPVDEYLMGKALPPHVSPFRISISNDEEELAELKKAVAEDRRILEDDVPDRVHEIRRMLDPSYNKANPTKDVHLSDDDDDEVEELDKQALEQDSDDSEGESSSEKEEPEVNSDDDVNEFNENIERSAASRKKLKSMLKKGDNKPTSKDKAEKKRKAIAERQTSRKSEAVETQKKRKLEEEAAKEEADKEMKMAVMEPKKRKLYKSMQIGIKKRKKELGTLEERRAQLREGTAGFDEKTRTLKVKK